MSLASHREAAGPSFDHNAFTNRFEIKYPSETSALAEVEALIADYLSPDEAMNGGQGYQVCSVYFDSPDLRFFRDKMEGELTRLKPRLRWYADSLDEAPSAYFLEMKGRYDRIVLKRRAALSRDLAEAILADPLSVPDSAISNSSVLGEFSYMVQRFDLRPLVTVSYHRKPFRGRFHNNLRMTFDRMLRCSLSTSLDAKVSDFRYFLPANRSIIELKYNETVSRYLLQRLNSHGLIQQTFSKYAHSVSTMISKNGVF